MDKDEILPTTRHTVHVPHDVDEERLAWGLTLSLAPPPSSSSASASPPPTLSCSDEDRLAWGLTLSLSPPQQQQPPSPTTTTTMITSSSPLEYTALSPFPVYIPRELLIFIPSYSYPLNLSMPLRVLEAQQLDLQEEKEDYVTAASSSSSSSSSLKRIRAVRPTNKPDLDQPPLPWATPKRGSVYSMKELIAKGLTKISGKVECSNSKCRVETEIQLDLMENFHKVWSYIQKNKSSSMHDNRAPNRWMNPVLPNCESCGKEQSMRPVIPIKKSQINWLFLFLAEMIAYVSAEGLKYFCKHSGIRITPLKDTTLLYSTYMGICKQLHPIIN